jgi:hypothetical protein
MRMGSLMIASAVDVGFCLRSVKHKTFLSIGGQSVNPCGAFHNAAVDCRLAVAVFQVASAFGSENTPPSAE